MNSTTKGWIVVISIVVIAVLGSFLTNGYGLFKTAAPAPAFQAYDPANDPQFADAVQSVVSTELARLEKAKTEAAAKIVKAKADSIAKVKAERKARELAAMPARVRQLEKELAALKAAKAAPAVTPVVAGTPTSNLVATPATTPAAPVATKTFEYKLEASDPATKKIGVTLNGWTEYKPGETISLSPGVYGFNAENSVTWAYDSVSMRMGKANFVVIVGGLELNTPGSDNKRSGANAYVCVNEDGTLTLIE